MSYRQNIKQDFNQGSQRRARSRRHAAIAIAAALIITGFSLGDKPSDTAPAVALDGQTMPVRLAIPLPADNPNQALTDIPEPPPLTWHEKTIKRGDNLALLFKKANHHAKVLHQIMQSGSQADHYKHLKVGQTIEFGTHQDGQLAALRFAATKSVTIESRLVDNQWQTDRIEQPIETRTHHASGIINDSLFLAGARAGLSDNTIMELAGIFGWDIDFALDIRKGDRFTVIYETRHLNGEQIGTGDILAAEFINQGKAYQAIQYTDADNTTDYYSPDGRSMRKAFLRTPVKFSRISSKFSRKRWHPVLNKWRSHKGVDYAAPRGTPIKATSNGRIAFAGRKGGYGKVIYIDNGQTYRTVYGHLNSFAKGVRKGKRVKQGQIIGYVGSTGLATGPHLHYELRVNGVHRNPLTIKLPKAQPINKKYLADFKNSSSTWLQRLALISKVQIAALNTPANKQPG